MFGRASQFICFSGISLRMDVLPLLSNFRRLFAFSFSALCLSHFFRRLQRHNFHQNQCVIFSYKRILVRTVIHLKGPCVLLEIHNRRLRSIAFMWSLDNWVIPTNQLPSAYEIDTFSPWAFPSFFVHFLLSICYLKNWIVLLSLYLLILYFLFELVILRNPRKFLYYRSCNWFDLLSNFPLPSTNIEEPIHSF